MATEKLFKFKDGSFPVKAGDTVIVSYFNGRRRPPEECTVQKVGRSLVHLNNGTSFYFDGRERSNYANGAIYSGQQGYENELERERVMDYISERFRYINRREYSLETLMKIKALLDAETKNN